MAPAVIDSKPQNVIKGTNELKDVIKSVMPSTVIVVTYDAKDQLLQQGSGFFVNDKGEVITNYHVMSGAEKAAIKTPNGSIYSITSIIAEDVTSDLIKLQADIKGSKVQFLTINKAVPEVGEKVVIIGSPVGLESTVSDGIISAVRDVPGFGSIIQTTAPISPGSSGSPVVNMRGEVLGVASAQMREGQNLNFVIPSAKIIELNEKKQPPSFAKKEKDKTQADDILTTALFYYLKDNFEKALPFFIQYLQINPDSDIAWFAWFNTGYCYGKLGRYEEAIHAFKQAIRLEPDDAVSHNNLGIVYGKLGRHEDAMQSYKQAIRLKPDDADAHCGLGATYGQLGRYDEAIQASKQAIRLKPDYAEAHHFLGVVYSILGRNEEAIQASKQAIRLKPDDAAAHGGLGAAYMGLGRNEEAIQAFKQAIRLKPDDAAAHFSLGLVYFIMGNRGSALEEYKILKELDEERANKLFNLIYR